MGPVAKKWLKSYRASYPLYKEAAALATDEIREALSGFPIAIHSISGRAKKPDSATEKVRRKAYGRPNKQMTDVIGVRVITSYAQGVEDVVRRLRDKYTVDDKNSVDKRKDLTIREVGYRSVHLVLSFGKISQTSEAAKLLSGLNIEVQVRSIVDHAWAEIDHELRYKSGVQLPAFIQRRFSALAGTLELVDQEFNNLANALVDLVQNYSSRYISAEMMDEEFDSARLLAFFAVYRPNAVKLGPQGLQLPFDLAHVCVRALAEVEVVSANAFLAIIESQTFRTLVRDYADRRHVEPGEVSALVLVATTVALVDPSLLTQYEGFNDPVLKSLVGADQSEQ